MPPPVLCQDRFRTIRYPPIAALFPMRYHPHPPLPYTLPPARSASKDHDLRLHSALLPYLHRTRVRFWHLRSMPPACFRIRRYRALFQTFLYARGDPVLAETGVSRPNPSDNRVPPASPVRSADRSHHRNISVPRLDTFPVSDNRRLRSGPPSPLPEAAARCPYAVRWADPRKVPCSLRGRFDKH